MQKTILATLAPIMVVVLAAFLIIGMAIPALPLYVHDELGFSTFMVGLAAGAEFAAALLSRFWSGIYADTKGARRAVIAGLWMCLGAGLFYLLSDRFSHLPPAAISLLLVGRTLLGGGESFVITGVLAWGLKLAGASNSGKAISWIGTALWAAFAAGAPAGSLLYERFGFLAIALATTILPLATLLFVFRLSPAAPTATVRPSISTIFKTIWVPGLGLALTVVGFGTITTFGALLFAQRDWDSAWIAFTTLGIAFILCRIALGHLPDRIGGARVALVSILVETAGLVMIWLAPSAMMVYIGSFVTGLGYSLIYPGFGVEVVRMAPADSRGLAMGAYSAFLDLSLGVSSPAMGLVADHWGLSTVFLVTILIVFLSSGIAVMLLPRPGPS